MPKMIDETMVIDLRKAIYQRKKDFAGVTKLTETLEKKMERK